MNLVKVLNTTYGPYAFGLVAILVVWFAIVAPEQRQNKIDVKSHQEVVQQLKEYSGQNERTASLMKDASVINERVVDKMNSAAEKMDSAISRIERLK